MVAEEGQTVAQDWAVEAMPTFVFLKEGKIVDRVVGAKKEELLQTITKHVAKLVLNLASESAINVMLDASSVLSI
ncbi:hypothetical protein K1719_005149 [Acacia pycnantha]|nr:hypothetical protein K1719_005149 [Acacia pycnantha]